MINRVSKYSCSSPHKMVIPMIALFKHKKNTSCLSSSTYVSHEKMDGIITTCKCVLNKG